MSFKTIVGRPSWSKTVLILAIVSLCCFMFAGVALAGGGQLNIIPDLNNPNPDASVKASHTYNYVFDAQGFEGVGVQSLYQDPQDLFIKFPTVADDGKPGDDQFDLSPAIGRTVPVKVTVNGFVYNMQIVPTIDNANHTAIFDFQSANLTKSGWVERIEILGLQVKNTHIPSDSYKIEFSHYQPFLFTIYKSIRVVETVGEITIDSPKTCANIKAGGSFEVKGKVIGTCTKPWDYTSWPVKIEILDKKGRPAIMPVQNECPKYTEDGRPIGDPMKPVCTSTVVGDTETTFTATLKMPGYPYKYNGVWTNDYVIKASTVEVKDAFSIPVGVAPAESIEDYAETTLVGCPVGDPYAYLGIRHWFCDFYCPEGNQYGKRAIALSLPETIHMIPAEPVKLRTKCPPEKIKLNAPVELTICLTDKYCNDALAVKQEKIDLAALQNGNMAGIFYDAAGNQISHVYVPIGQSCVTVTLRPTLKGPIVIEARAENLTSNPSEIVKAICETTVIDGDQMNLDLIAKVTDKDGNPRAGWPVKGAYWIMPVGATQDYKVHVEITDCNGKSYYDLNKNGMYDVGEEVATWGLDPGNIQFGARGPYRGHNICNPWDTVPHVFCTTKQHIWIYPNISIKRCITDAGYKEPVIDYPACLHVKVVVEGPAGTETMSVENEIKNFVSPVELMRSLNAETWQTLSTPKTLAGTGDLNFLIGEKSYLAALTYRNGKWDQLLPGEELQPLYCYYVKMKQPKMPGELSEECYWNAAYIFDRATDPSQMIPPVRTLGIGWQAVGMAVQDAVEEPVEDPLWQQQSDYLYRALGTICKCCKIVYNPGFPKVENPHYPNLERTRLGNLADFQTVAVSQGTSGAWWDDPYAVVYNGDNYWVYLCETQDLAANVGLEVVDP